MNTNIDHNFTYHPPKPAQMELYQELRQRGKELALYFADVVPDSREQSIAITKLEEAIFWANAGIARNS